MKKLLFAATPLGSRAADALYLLFRLHLGLSIALGAGWSKLINLTTIRDLDKLLLNPGQLSTPDWFVQQVAGLGFTFPSPYLWATLAVWGEFVGGLLLALGLLTRLSAVQLAVQFFVIAFLWYDSPEPIVGMYYQQLLFWAFVLTTALGGGRYSLDYWLTQRRPALARPVSLRPAVVAAVLALGLLVASSSVAGPVFSDLFIEPGKQFELGGGQVGSFQVQAHNKGPVPVYITERYRFGGTEDKGVLRPGQRTTLRFGAGSAALLRNASAEKANLGLKITGAAGLGMRYAGNTTPAAAAASAPAPTVRAADFRPLLSYDWLGTLTYRDYQTSRPVTLRTRLNGMQAGPQELVLDYQYQEPEGGMVKGFDRLRLSADGRTVNWDEVPMRLLRRTATPDGRLHLLLEGEGQDDNRPATIRRAVLIGPAQCRIRKTVRFAPDTTFLLRNEYQFTR